MKVLYKGVRQNGVLYKEENDDIPSLMAILKECNNVKIGEKNYEVSSFSLEYSETRNASNKRDSELIVLLKTKNS